MASWYRRRQQPTGETAVVVLPSAWAYGGPTSDSASASSSVSSLVAAAVRVGASDDKEGAGTRKKKGQEGAAPWDVEAWAMYNEVGELRYTANAIAGRIGQAVPYLTKNGVRVKDSEDDPILELITPQMVERMGLNVFVGGGTWLIGLPASPTGDASKASANSKWIVRSSVEVKKERGKVTIDGDEYAEKDIYMAKIWDPHPAYWGEADSPVRAALPVLRLIVGLTQHQGAQIDSRLAGAGVYWIPNEILSNPKVPDQAPGQQVFSQNPVLNAIMQSMIIPMQDRDNASAVVPLLLGAPGDWIDKIRFDSFSTPFDERTQELQTGNIKRLALCLDAPPELLLGMGDSNHWAAWLVRDEVVQIHVDPRCDLIADALTTEFYRPIKKQQNAQQGRPDDSDEYEVHFDTSSLVQRPNRLADASQLYSLDLLGSKALLSAGGFSDEDMPSSNERAIRIALSVAQANPQLIDNIPEIVASIKAVLDGTPETGVTVVESAREPGTLRPLVPANTTNPVPRNGARPLAEADALPQAGSPV